MAFDTDWDVDSYKLDNESEEHWELRKSFIVQNKQRFPEDRLICLSQVFSNMEFLDCKYPEKVMDLVNELSEGVIEDFREQRKDDIKRTFVSASDAADAKVKRKT